MKCSEETLENAILEYVNQIRLFIAPEIWGNILMDCSKNEIFVLLLLYRNTAASMTQLAEYIGVPLNTATGVVARMEKRALVCRQRNPEDRRVITVALTEKGRRQIVDIIKTMAGYGKRVVETLTTEEVLLSGRYDRVVMDCAPTGETLSLLKSPEMFGDFVEKVLPIKRKAIDTAGHLVEKLTKIPMPEDGAFEDIERLMDKLGRLRALMLNKTALSLRIVTTPEKIVIQEARRNFTCLHLYGYNVDAVIVNKIYPQAALSGYFTKWTEL